MDWPLRNGLRILIDITPFEGAARIIVRDPLFILGDDEASPLSVGGAIKQQITSVNTVLQLRQCEVLTDNYQPCRSREGHDELLVSADHFCTSFLGFAWTTRSLLTLLCTTEVPDRDRSLRLWSLL